MINKAPKYSKIELLEKDHVSGSITKLEFLDCGIVITGDYLIIVIDETNEFETDLTSTGKIFPLSRIHAYKTYSP